MEHITPLLEAVRVSDRELCPGGDERGAAFQVWDQARAGLLASIVGREAKPATTSLALYEQYYEPNQDRVRKLVVQRKKQTSARPFIASAQPSFFAASGYMIDGGAQGRVFNAPDADVILDESFARTHCFRRQSADREHPNQVGVAFSPAPGDGRDTIVDVRGTIWLDTAVSQIRSLEFTYTSLERPAMAVGAGGRIEFRTAPNGISFIERWSLRLPVIEALAQATNASSSRLPGEISMRPPRRQDRSDVRLIQVVQSGGVVLDASWADGTAWHDTPTGIKGTVKQTGGDQPLANAVVTIEGSSDTTLTAADGSFTLASVIPGKYTLLFADTALREYVPERKQEKPVDVAHGDYAQTTGQLGSFMDVMAKVCKGVPITDRVAVVAGRVQFPGSAPRGAQVRSDWLSDVTATGNSLTARPGEQLADLDAQNRFVVCGVAQDRKVSLRVMAGAQTFTDTLVYVPKGPFLSVSWRPATRTLASIDPGRVVGTVVRSGSRQPIAGAQISLAGSDRVAMTQNDGTFEVSGVPPGEYAMQVRHVGDGLLVDTVRIASGQRIERNFEMSKATALDTVRAIAGGLKGMSSTESAFETRRARGLGNFIIDSVIRKSENRRLSDVLTTYMPSLKIVTGKIGGQYVASGRGMGTETVPATFGDNLKAACYASIYYNGTRIYDPRIPGAQGVNLNDYTVAQMGRIEFYAGPAQTPPEFGDGPCGVLVMWSREK